MSVLIVGASVAGVGTARALRAKGYAGPITLLDEQRHLPYDKPPLSKEMLGAEGVGDPVPLVSAAQLDALDIQLRLGVRAAALDTERKVVVTESAEQIGYETLVIATGVKPRTLPFPAPPGVYTLRSLDDARAIREELGRAARLVIVGAGFIGAELATAARAHGVDVTILEVQAVPMAHLFGVEVAQALNTLHTGNEVTVLSGVQVAGFAGPDRVTAVQLSDGSSVEASFVVVAIGAHPATGWLESSGLPTPDGIACDNELRVIGVAGVYAAGDVARWPHGLYESELRIEHWTNANEHAVIVAASILGRPASAPQVPYVWSYQYGRLIQIVGRPSSGAPVVISGRPAEGESFLAVYAGPQGRVVGAVCVDNARAMMACRKAIKQGLTVEALRLPEATRGR
jgi:NADPH-dependent 2,4-dienoyl-CoA reductase/sulfur reductase-like enzyme